MINNNENVKINDEIINENTYFIYIDNSKSYNGVRKQWFYSNDLNKLSKFIALEYIYLFLVDYFMENENFETYIEDDCDFIDVEKSIINYLTSGERIVCLLKSISECDDYDNFNVFINELLKLMSGNSINIKVKVYNNLKSAMRLIKCHKAQIYDDDNKTFNNDIIYCDRIL